MLRHDRDNAGDDVAASGTGNGTFNWAESGDVRFGGIMAAFTMVEGS